MTKATCDMCNDELDSSLIRTFEYLDQDNNYVIYDVCEDCIYHHIKNNYRLGNEIAKNKNKKSIFDFY